MPAVDPNPSEDPTQAEDPAPWDDPKLHSIDEWSLSWLFNMIHVNQLTVNWWYQDCLDLWDRCRIIWMRLIFWNRVFWSMLSKTHAQTQDHLEVVLSRSTGYGWLHPNSEWIDCNQWARKSLSSSQVLRFIKIMIIDEFFWIISISSVSKKRMSNISKEITYCWSMYTTKSCFDLNFHASSSAWISLILRFLLSVI